MKTSKSSTARILLATCFAGTVAMSQSTANLSADDQSAIQALVGQYSQALGGCRAAEFADLFVPGTGTFASGFRGRMVGRERLIALVESERQCVAPPNAAKGKAPARPAATPPTPVLDVTPAGVHGIVSVNGAEYQDEYAKTPQGWKFASRTVITTAEKTAGLDTRALIAIERLNGGKLADYHEPDQNGVSRLMTSGVRVTVANGQVNGRAFLKDGSYDDQVYEKTDTGDWRIKSSTHVAAGAK